MLMKFINYDIFILELINIVLFKEYFDNYKVDYKEMIEIMI